MWGVEIRVTGTHSACHVAKAMGCFKHQYSFQKKKKKKTVEKHPEQCEFYYKRQRQVRVQIANKMKTKNSVLIFRSLTL